MAIKNNHFSVSEPLENILHINFDKRTELTKTFLRFQEHYESPEFKGKIFSLDEYKKWYIANSKKGKETGKFTYYTDWKGFNIPSEILVPFYRGDFDPLSKREKNLIFSDEIKNKKEKFYIVGTFGPNSVATLKHEIAHGLFYVNQGYKSNVLKILSGLSKEARCGINDYLKSRMGYHQDVFDDETHAYILTDEDRLKRHGIKTSAISNVALQLQYNFYKFSEGLF